MNLCTQSKYSICKIFESSIKYYLLDDNFKFVHVKGYYSLENLICKLDELVRKNNNRYTNINSISIEEYIKIGYKKHEILQENKTINELLNLYSYYLI